MSKTGAYIILATLLNLPVELPEVLEEVCPVGVETVVAAEEVRPREGVKVEVVVPDRGGVTRGSRIEVVPKGLGGEGGARGE